MLKLFSFLILIICLPVMAQVPIHVNGWPHISTTGGYAEYAVARFGNDQGQLNVIYNTMNGEIQKFDLDGNFMPGWPTTINPLISDLTPIVLDIDHDGRSEVLTIGIMRETHYLYDQIYLFDDDGSIMSGFPIRNQFTYTLNAADLDNDNEYEIIYFDPESDLINCVDRFGDSKPGWPLSFHMPGSEYSLTGGVAIGDLDLDGNNEILLSSFREIYAFRFDGTAQPGFPIHLQGDSLYNYAVCGLPPTLADIDGDGYLEILFCADNWSPINPINFRSLIVIYKNDGTIKNGWPHYFDRQLIKNVPTPVDLNRDGLPEIGFQYGESLTFVDINCQPLPGWPARLLGLDSIPRASSSDVIAVDINGDGSCEIFTDFNSFYADSMGHDSTWYYGHGYLYAIDHTGHDLPGYPITVRGLYFRMPPSFTLDSITNKLYMGLATDFVMPGLNDTIFLDIYTFPDSTGPTTQWPMLSHDNLMTRNYNFVDRVTSIKNEEEILPASPILMQNHPNPFNFSTIIEFYLPEAEHFTVSIYDINGRKVVDLYDDTFAAGHYRHQVDMNLPSGVYFYTLKTNDSQITRKMMLLK
jgi:hypothetical protein